MTDDHLGNPGRLIGSLLGTLMTLVVLACVLPVITPYVVALGLLVIVARVVWFYTNH
ncbi:MAG TPA: hypothetical protein VJT75_11800 [Thermoleophilaceae bacterium]|nr:hypothetical protein [Thermoleophilaceae bacterium]